MIIPLVLFAALGLYGVYAIQFNPLVLDRASLRVFLIAIWTALYSLAAVMIFYVARVSKTELYLLFGLVFTGMTFQGIVALLMFPIKPAEYWLMDTIRGLAGTCYFAGIWYYSRTTKAEKKG